MNIIEKIFTSIETRVAFSDKWYGIFFNPFYISRKQILNAVRRFSETVPDKSNVLDVGCGAKPYEYLFPSCKYVGIDVKGGGLRDSTKKVDKFFNGEKIPFKTGSFDVVIATEVLEHVISPEKLITEMIRVLKPHGKLFITMPFVWPEHGVPYDFQRFTSFQLRRLLNKHGIKVLSVNKTTGIFGTCGQILSDFFYEELARWVFGSKVRYAAKFVLFRLICYLTCFPTQLIFESLDIIFGRKGIPLDFVVTAWKK